MLGNVHAASSHHRVGAGGAAGYVIDVQYSYVVSGATYNGNRYSFPEVKFLTKNEADLQVQALLSNESQAMYYLSSDPSQATLQFWSAIEPGTARFVANAITIACVLSWVITLFIIIGKSRQI